MNTIGVFARPDLKEAGPTVAGLVRWISERGRRVLKEIGFSPPVKGPVQLGLPPPKVPCPHCDSTDTSMESMFGPTLCRAIYYCRRCRQSFEHFKTVS